MTTNPQDKARALEACPFCGEEKSLIHGENGGWNVIKCDNCGACGPYGSYSRKPSDNSDEEKWNERISPPALSPEVVGSQQPAAVEGDAELQNEICGIVTKYGVRDIYEATTEILLAVERYKCAENAELRNPMTAKNECTHPELRAGTCLKCKKKVSARNVCDCGAINCTPSKPAQMTAKNEMPCGAVGKKACMKFDQIAEDCGECRGKQMTRQPEGLKLKRYGIQWNGPKNPIAVEMPDGYWTPYHEAARALEGATKALKKSCECLKDIHGMYLERGHPNESIITAKIGQQIADDISALERLGGLG